MMFERFTDSARQVVVRAQEDARRLGHNYIGCEHLLLAAAPHWPARHRSLSAGGSRPRLPAATSRSRRGPRRAWSCPCARLILSSLGASRDSLRAAVLARYRKAS
jgi:Clp amino terminal domain, pathogenicity island component